MPAIAVFTQVKGAESGGGQVKDQFFDLTFVTDGVNANYTVGGIPLASRQVGGLIGVFSMAPVGHANAAGTNVTDIFHMSWDYKRNVIQIFGDAVGAAGISESAAVDISAVTFRVRVTGV